MNLQQFFTVARDTAFWQQSHCHVFVYGDEESVSLSLLANIRAVAQDCDALPVQQLHASQDLSAVYAQLQTSFLGSSYRYWLMPAELDAKELRELLAYLKTYTGPHKLLLFLSQEQAEQAKVGTMVQLDEQVDQATCVQLAAFVGKKLSLRAQRLLQKIFKEQPRIPLSASLLLIEYVMLVGVVIEQPNEQPLSFDPEQAKKDLLVEEQLYEQLRCMIKPESSLFTLSQYFFAKQPEAFFKYWATVKDVYPEQFWVSFWSEQLYRAFFYVMYMQQGNQSDAQKIGMRLPFSFLQRDWRKHTPAALAAAHGQLYELDGALKNSRGELGFDRLYQMFFK